MFVHCANHSLDLALQEIGKKTELMCNALVTVRDVSNIILESAKRQHIYKGIVLQPSPEEEEEENRLGKPTQLLSLCPTRWSVRVKALRRFLENYSRVQETLQAIIADKGSISMERRHTVLGYKSKLLKTETLFSIEAAIEIFALCELLAKSLQTENYSAAGVLRASELLQSTLTTLRTSESFHATIQRVIARAQALKLKDLVEPRATKPPKRREQSLTSEPPAKLDATGLLRKNYFAVLDLISNEIKRRFDQPGLKRLVELEGILSKSVDGMRYSVEELTLKLGSHATDFDVGLLCAELTLIPSVIKCNRICSVMDIAESMSKQPQAILSMLGHVVKLIELILTVPASAASAERSFSALKRVKTEIRGTMTQARLNHLLLLHIHQSKVLNVNLENLLKEFVSKTAERKKVFGV